MAIILLHTIVTFAYLYKNEEEITESQHYTYLLKSNGNVGSLGSRTLYMRLDAGDQVSLRTGVVKNLYQISLCLELVRVMTNIDRNQ